MSLGIVLFAVGAVCGLKYAVLYRRIINEVRPFLNIDSGFVSTGKLLRFHRAHYPDSNIRKRAAVCWVVSGVFSLVGIICMVRIKAQ